MSTIFHPKAGNRKLAKSGGSRGDWGKLSAPRETRCQTASSPALPPGLVAVLLPQTRREPHHQVHPLKLVEPVLHHVVEQRLLHAQARGATGA